jgi:hypothetical protein
MLAAFIGQFFKASTTLSGRQVHNSKSVSTMQSARQKLQLLQHWNTDVLGLLKLNLKSPVSLR